MHKNNTIARRPQVPEPVSSQCSSVEKLRELLIRNPASWGTFRALGDLLESEGNSSSAKECYLGRIPIDVQDRLFDSFSIQSKLGDLEKNVLPGHASSVKSCVSKCVNSSPRFERYSENGIQSKPTKTTVFKDANVWFDGFNTAVSSDSGLYDSSTLVGNLGPVFAAAQGKEVLRIQGDVVLMGARGSNNYYHWMTDILPKLEVMKESGLDLSEDCIYVFTNITSKFQIETLKKFGVHSKQIFETNKHGSNIRADSLIIPEMKNTMGLGMGEWLPKYLRNAYGFNYESGAYRKLLISRNLEKSHGRGISNIQDFNCYFEEQGYEIIFPEKYSVAEQAKLFSEATHVVGSHGAGLTNIVFCRPGTKVYEFYGQHLAPCYWALSELSDLDYFNQDCSINDQVDGTTLAQAKSLSARRSSSFSIDLEKINTEHI